MELVFGPNLRTAEEALYMVKDLTVILKHLGVCTCRMTGNNDNNITISIFTDYYQPRIQTSNPSAVTVMVHHFQAMG